ncbi:TetR family transcriptional regulator C-terminal domain-containing protein [Nocardia nova]|jgi:hypothetical protein|uniref:TetR family transcriptional regulator C-terminal domain-containing protein n=1 Tax=Nocardia nova TaxID=37330 RepID=UPI001E4B6F53|nr:TetR family transcriptional regulator C-terminal domain-containing protein [Nocardia nova]
MEEWGVRIQEATLAALDSDAGPRERYEAFWRHTIASYSDNRQLWLASIEAGVEAERSPRVRELMTRAMAEGRSGLAAGLLGIPEDAVDDRAVRTIGALQLALMSGVLMQWTLDPEHAPTERDLTEGLLALADRISGGAEG